MRNRILSIAVAALAIGLTSAATAEALTYAGAESEAKRIAHETTGYTVNEGPCTGPYENVKGKTQYACYGEYEGGPYRYWQVNVGPYGEETYYRETNEKIG